MTVEKGIGGFSSCIKYMFVIEFFMISRSMIWEFYWMNLGIGKKCPLVFSPKYFLFLYIYLFCRILLLFFGSGVRSLILKEVYFYLWQ